jgi:class 3 adenylate cyclase
MYVYVYVQKIRFRFSLSLSHTQTHTHNNNNTHTHTSFVVTMEKDTLHKPTSSFLNLGVVSSNNSQKSGNRRAPRAPRFSALLLAGKGFLSNKISAMHEENDEDLDSTVLHTYLQFVPAIAHFHIRKRAREKVAMLAIEEDPEVVDQVHYVHDHWAAALFLDISGFTRLSQSLGAEKTKLHCNKFFSKILEVISTYRGDVVKFMGDAVLAIWPVPLGSTDFYKRSACLVAAECAKSIMSVGSYDAEDEVERAKKSDKVQVKLRLHCGLACGPLHMFCVGRKQRSEILVGGDILPQLAQCEKEAKMGQTIMSESFRTSTPSTRTLIKNPHISTSTGKHLPKRSMVFKETKKTEKGNYLLLWERIVELDGNDDSDESSEEEVLKPSEETKSGGFLNKCLPFLSSSSDSKISPDASFLAVGRRTFLVLGNRSGPARTTSSLCLSLSLSRSTVHTLLPPTHQHTHTHTHQQDRKYRTNL